MAKKIAVLVRDRQEEALRMAVGMILLDDVIDVYVLDGKVQENEQNSLNLETIKEMDMNIYTNIQGNDGMEYLSNAEMAERLAQYDHILPY